MAASYITSPTSLTADIGIPSRARLAMAAWVGKQQIGGVIRQYSVDLLRDPAVERAESSLHVRHGDVDFDRGQGTAEGCVRVAVDNHPIGPFRESRPVRSPR